MRFDDLTFLVVDDEPDSREMLAAVLEHRGARVGAGRESAESALRDPAQQPVDLVIADIAMPIVDGYELMRRIRAAGHRCRPLPSRRSRPPTIATTRSSPATPPTCAKPIDGPSLARTVRTLVPSFPTP